MEREQVIRMAREAGLSNDFGHFGYPYLPELERFAALVADAEAKRMHAEGMVTVGYMRQQIAAERNKVAQWMMAQGYATGHGDTTEDLLDELDWQITESWSKVVMTSVGAEREACAKVCEHQPHWVACAAAIRARGQA
jgi:hypothetical protein